MAYSDIDLTLIDANTGKVITQGKVPAEKLPQTFELQTTLHFGDVNLQVVKADPMTADEFKQTGKLVVTVQQIQYVSPNDIWYTLPTIRDAIPPANGSLKSKLNILEMHEDDWGQIELISEEFQPLINAELADIQRIYSEHSDTSGNIRVFSKLHIRNRIKSPITSKLTLSELRRGLPASSHELQGVAYQQYDRLISGAHVFEVNGWALYCLETNLQIVEIGLRRKQTGNRANDLATFLTALMTKHHLVLIDWCRLIVLTSNDERILTYLQGQL